ncbi:MAG: DUF4433 domain-containing protein [Proteobacteria bacterium]|nr:DUF4433 domain-containing protein [Pseudomonadota bacterium]
MTHIDNLDGILAVGGLLPYNKMARRSYCDLANDDVQKGRAAVVVQSSSRPLHDYVPLYFGFKTPMVVRNKDQNQGMIFLRFSLDILGMPDVMFTDGNARSSKTRFFKFQQLDDLESLNASAISKVKWVGNEELKRQKQAEILVPDFLDWDQVYDIIVFNEEAKNQVWQGHCFGIQEPISSYV